MNEISIQRAKKFVEANTDNIGEKVYNLSCAVKSIIEAIEHNDREFASHVHMLPKTETPTIVDKPVDYLGMVREFHREFKCISFDQPQVILNAHAIGRLRLITEELGELTEAMDKQDIVGIADSLADLLYVVFGTAIAYGLPMDRIFTEVHASNMTKKGGHMENGKFIKPDTYQPVDLSWLKEL